MGLDVFTGNGKEHAVVVQRRVHARAPAAAFVVVMLGRLPNVLEAETFAGFRDREDFVDLLSQGVIGKLFQDRVRRVADRGLPRGRVGLEGVPALLKVFFYVLLALHAQVDEQTVHFLCCGPLVWREPAELQDLVPAGTSSSDIFFSRQDTF